MNGKQAIKHLVLSALMVLPAGCASFQGLLGDGRVVQTSTGVCVDLTPENKLHPVGSCVKSDVYEFYVLQAKRQYPKHVFQHKLQTLVRSAIAATALPREKWHGARVDVWLFSPVFRPADTHLYVVVGEGSEGAFGFPLALDMDRWEIRSDALTLFGRDKFPTRKARQAGVLMVELQNYAPDRPERLGAWVAAAGGQLRETSAGVLRITTPVFGEASVARALLAHPESRYFLRQIHYIPAGLAEGAKARSLSFTLGGRSRPARTDTANSLEGSDSAPES